jgi:hypothetical protein
MNPIGQNSIAGASGTGDFEDTLRLIARLSAPEGLEERVKASLLSAPVSSKARILAWPTALRPSAAWMRSAAAAAIVAVVIGGSWGVYSRVQPNQPARTTTTQPRISAQGGFSSAGAMRTPQTLNGPVVEHPAVARPAVAAPLLVSPAAKPVARSKQAPPLPGKTKAASKVIQPAALPKD